MNKGLPHWKEDYPSNSNPGTLLFMYVNKPK